MNNNDDLQAVLTRIRSGLPYAVESLHIDITEALLARMEELSLSRSELADRLECSRAYVTKAFGRPGNFTLETLAKMAYALDMEAKVTFARKADAGFQNVGVYERAVFSRPIFRDDSFPVSSSSIGTLSHSNYPPSSGTNEIASAA